MGRPYALTPTSTTLVFNVIRLEQEPFDFTQDRCQLLRLINPGELSLSLERGKEGSLSKYLEEATAGLCNSV